MGLQGLQKESGQSGQKACGHNERKEEIAQSKFFKRKEIFEKNKPFFPLLLLLYGSSTSNELGRTFSEGLAPAELH